MLKLSKADKIILATLEHDARCKEKDLATACHLSKDAVRYRINRLKREGIIQRHSCFVDYTKMGYTSYKLYMRISGTQEVWKALRTYLDGKTEVFCRFEAHGSWNFGIAYFARSLEHYYELERELLDKFGSSINDLQLCHMVDAKIFPNRLFMQNPKRTQVFGETAHPTIDDVDRALLAALHKDSSQTLVSLAEQLHTTIDTIKRHKLNLETARIIRAYTTDVFYTKLGFETYKVFISVKNYTAQVERAILATIEEHPQLRNYIRIVGPWKIEAEFLCANYDELDKIIINLQSAFPDAITAITYAVFRNEKYYPSGKLLD